MLKKQKIRVICTFLTLAGLLAVQSLRAFDLVIEITGADEQWETGITNVSSETTNSSGANFSLPNEAVVCHADEVWNYEFETVPDGAINSSGADFALPNEALVCHADEVWGGDLNSVAIDDGSAIQQEIITGEQEWSEDKTIDRKIIIAQDATLLVKKGVTILFTSFGSIEVQGKLLVKGTKLHPVIIKKEDDLPGFSINISSLGQAKIMNANIIGGGSSVPLYGTIIASGQDAKLEIQGSTFENNIIAVQLSGVRGENIKVNRTLFKENQLYDVLNINPGGYLLPDFRWNWWGSDLVQTSTIYSGNPLTNPNFHDPVIIIPGFAGSGYNFSGEWEIDPIFHSFDGLISELVNSGYEKGVDLFELGYDWTKSNIENAAILKNKISEIKNKNNWPKVDIVAHSMGGLLARQYVESNDYLNDVDQLITLGTPQNGSPAAYTQWEAGEFASLGLKEMFAWKYFYLHAQEEGYSDIFEYIHERPIASLQELLPVYSYLYDMENNGLLRQYPDNYPTNSFLENLNSDINKQKLENIEFDKIVGDVDSNESTVAGFKVKKSTNDILWVHGYPDGFEFPLGSRGFVVSSGDRVVPLYSSESKNIKFDEEFKINSNHEDLPVNGRFDAIELLTKVRPSTGELYNPINNILIVFPLSPVDIQIVAPDGKRLGKNFLTGEILDEIPGAYYSGYNTNAEILTVPNPIGKYEILTQGTGAGNYTLEAAAISQDSGTGQVKETKVAIQGTAVLGKVEPTSIKVDGEGAIAEDDILAPIIKINSPENGKTYLNSSILPINYQLTDNKTVSEKIIKEIHLDGATTTSNVIDLAFQKTGSHGLAIRAQDEAGNVATTTVAFSVFATIDSIIANVRKFSDAGLIKKPQTIIFNAQLKALKVQFDVLDKLKSNNKLTAKTKTAAVKVLELVINKQIDLLVKEIQKAVGRGIDSKIAALLIDSLKYVRIK